MRGVMVNVYCDDSTHPTKKVSLETFVKGDGQAWMLMPVKRRGGDGFSRWSQSALDELDQLVDTGPNGPVATGVRRSGVKLRYRYELDCPLCGLSLQARSEKLAPVLNVLADHAEYAVNENGDEIGVFSVSLRALAARITSK